MNLLVAFLLVFIWFPVAAAAIDDMGDHAGFAHAMDVRTVRIDDFPVVFHYGQVRPEFNSPAENSTVSRRVLDTGWKFRFDPENEGDASEWAAATLPPGPWADVRVPHCWDMMPGGRFHDWHDTTAANPPHYNGAAWYRLKLDHRPTPGKHHRIEFLGVQQRARIFLNGREVALHEGGGQPFSIDVTTFLRDGKNLLALKVIRRPNHQPLTPGASKEPAEIEQIHGPHPKAPDNWPYAGIIRDVTLITENAVTVRKTQLRTGDGNLEAAAVLTNYGDQAARATVTIESPAITGPPEPRTVDLPAGCARVIRFRAPLHQAATSWTTAHPVIHNVTVKLTAGNGLVSEWNGRFGIRSFGARDGQFVLNGQSVFLKGVAVYEETPKNGAALLPADHERIAQLCRDCGANFLRLHVSQRAPLAYQLADTKGFMVAGEWGGFWYRERAMAAQTTDPLSIYQSHARCAIWDLMNHPSVVLWGTHNESHQFCPEYEPFVAMGTRLVRELDWQLRPVTWAAWHPHKGQPHFEHADAVGFNEYRGAMDPFDELDPDMTRTAGENPGKPLIILENGAWAQIGSRGSIDQRGTEDWQADLLKRQYGVLANHVPPLAGYTYWLLTDYRSRKFYTAGSESDGYSTMGLYSRDGKPKLVRDVFREFEWIGPAR